VGRRRATGISNARNRGSWPSTKPGPDEQDKRSVVPIELADADQWLFGTQEDAQRLVRFAPVGVFDAGPSACPSGEWG